MAHPGDEKDCLPTGEQTPGGPVKMDIVFHRSLAKPQGFSGIVRLLAERLDDAEVRFTKIAAIESLGMPLGGALAILCSSELVLIRKFQNDVPLELEAEFLIGESFDDHSKKQKRFRVFKAAIEKGDKVLIVDEHSETTAQVKAAACLIKQCGGHVVGIALVSAAEKARYVLKRKEAPCPVIIATDGGQPYCKHVESWAAECDQNTDLYW